MLRAAGLRLQDAVMCAAGLLGLWAMGCRTLLAARCGAVGCVHICAAHEDIISTFKLHGTHRS